MHFSSTTSSSETSADGQTLPSAVAIFAELFGSGDAFTTKSGDAARPALEAALETYGLPAKTKAWYYDLPPPPVFSRALLPTYTHVVNSTYPSLLPSYNPNAVLYINETGDLYVGNIASSSSDHINVLRGTGNLENVAAPNITLENIPLIRYLEPSDGPVDAQYVYTNSYSSFAYYNSTHLLTVALDQILLVGTTAPSTIQALTSKNSSTTINCDSLSSESFTASTTLIDDQPRFIGQHEAGTHLYGITRNPTTGAIYVSSIVAGEQFIDPGEFYNDGTKGCIFVLNEADDTIRKLDASTWVAAGMMAHLWQMDIDDEGSLYVPSSPTAGFDGTAFSKNSSVFKVNGTSGSASLVATGFHEAWGLRLWPRSLSNPYVGSSRNTHVFVANTKNHTIDVVMPDGTVQFVAGAGRAGNPAKAIAEGFNSNFTCIPQLDFSTDAQGNILNFYTTLEEDNKILRFSRSSSS